MYKDSQFYLCYCLVWGSDCLDEWKNIEVSATSFLFLTLLCCLFVPGGRFDNLILFNPDITKQKTIRDKIQLTNLMYTAVSLLSFLPLSFPSLHCSSAQVSTDCAESSLSSATFISKALSLLQLFLSFTTALSLFCIWNLYITHDVNLGLGRFNI